MATIGNQIDAAFVFARSDLVNVCDPEKTQTMKKPMTRSRAAKKKALAITRAKPNKRSAVSTRARGSADILTDLRSARLPNQTCSTVSFLSIIAAP